MINRVVCAYTDWGTPVFHLYKNDEMVGRARSPQGIARVTEIHGGPAPVIRGHIADTHAKVWKDACELL
jgi:hypothetical protein